MIKGIDRSDLLSDLYEGKSKKVPVGKKIIYQDHEKNSDDVKPITAGQPVTNLDIDQFDAFGSERQGKATKRDTLEDEIEFNDREQINDGLIDEVSFDKEEGSLVIVKKNGKVINVSGLLTQSDYGVGEQGPVGEPGLPGFEGYDGEDGEEGEDGCEGPEGSQGSTGTMGAIGADGVTGVQGPFGQNGLEGIMGPVGERGINGYEGSRGPAGTECEAGSGPPGPDGADPNMSVVISSDEPPNAVLWGIPE